MSKQAVYGLRWKAQQLRAEALTLMKEAEGLEQQATQLELHVDDLKPEAVERMVSAGLAAEDEWLEKVYQERVAMRARGEEIDLPEDPSGMKAMLAAESAATMERKAKEKERAE